MKKITEVLATILIGSVVILGIAVVVTFMVGFIFDTLWPLVLEIIGELGNAWRG